MKKTKTTNPELVKLIRLLNKQSRENKTKLWKDVAKRLSNPRRNRIVVNISRLNRYTKKKETVVVPGKVLGTGKINHPITIAALGFSEKAKEKIEDAKGKTKSLPQLIKKNPKGSNIRIIG